MRAHFIFTFAERANKQRTPRAVAIFVHTKRFPLRKPFFLIDLLRQAVKIGAKFEDIWANMRKYDKNEGAKAQNAKKTLEL